MENIVQNLTLSVSHKEQVDSIIQRFYTWAGPGTYSKKIGEIRMILMTKFPK
jgi:hypothetical protein